LPIILAEGACLCNVAKKLLARRTQSLEKADKSMILFHEDWTGIITNGTHWCILAHEQETTTAQELIWTLRLKFIITR
jgi:hypothetical protein